MDLFWPAVASVVTAAAMKAVDIVKTRKQAKRDDLNDFTASTGQMLETINSLVDQNREVIGRLVEEQGKVFALEKEQGELLAKVDKLQKTVDCLTRKLDKYIKNEKVNSND